VTIDCHDGRQKAYSSYVCQLTEGIQRMFMSADRGNTDYIYVR